MTLVLVVPDKRRNEWFAEYETLTEYIVPRSSSVLYQEGDLLLVNVSMFRRVVDDFKNRARERRYVVKDFEWDSDRIAGAVPHDTRNRRRQNSSS